MSLSLEEFEQQSQNVSDLLADMVPKSQLEAEKGTAYEQGYQAGWDDATKAESQDQTRIGADFARNLQDLSFTFHEARAHVLNAVEPLINELLDKLLPALVVESLGLRILEELRPLIENDADSPIELMVAPSSRLALEKQLQSCEIPAIQLTEEVSLAEGQAYLRVGHTERQIDLSGALDRITDAVRGLYALNERTLRHAG